MALWRPLLNVGGWRMLHFLWFWEEQPPSLTPSSGVRLNWALMVPEHCIVQNRDGLLVETDPSSGSWVMSYSDRLWGSRQLYWHLVRRLVFGYFHLPWVFCVFSLLAGFETCLSGPELGRSYGTQEPFHVCSAHPGTWAACRGPERTPSPCPPAPLVVT